MGMTDEIREQLEAEELAAEGQMEETLNTEPEEAKAEKEPLDIEAMAREVRRRQQEEVQADIARAEAEKLRKYAEDDAVLIAMFDKAYIRHRMEEAMEREKKNLKMTAISIAANESRKTDVKQQQMPQTMAGQNAQKKRNQHVRVYHSELGSLSSWFIVIVMLLALIARMAGVV